MNFKNYILIIIFLFSNIKIYVLTEKILFNIMNIIKLKKEYGVAT